MIKVKHPDDKCNINQEEVIRNTPLNKREFQELLFSYGNATYLYHSKAYDFKPSNDDYIEWISGLEPAIQKGMEERGFLGCLGVLSFTRYVNEKHDVGMVEYVTNLMGEDDYAKYLQLISESK